MLKTRVATAVVLLAVLLAVLLSQSFAFFALIAAVFFAAAAWEGFRLFGSRHPIFGAAIWTAAFVYLLFKGNSSSSLIFGLCVAIWVVRLAPSLAIGLPSLDGIGNRLLGGIYCIAILGCFLSIAALLAHSVTYLLSVMAIVWVADIGAYFAGKAFGKRKLAPTISPGKSWEGAIGGWLAVLLVAAAATTMEDTFEARVQTTWGWSGFLAVMTLLVIASVVGDLFESKLKRRAGMKDSSNLLPGHGGVLDRIDALIPALPFAVLFDLAMK